MLSAIVLTPFTLISDRHELSVKQRCTTSVQLELFRASGMTGRASISHHQSRNATGARLALVIGIGATGVSAQFVLFSGLAGLLAGALSMGAGEFVSVRSQRELLEATEPGDDAHAAASDLDLDANELALVYRAAAVLNAVIAWTKALSDMP